MSEVMVLKPNEVWKYAMEHFSWIKDTPFVIGNNEESGIEITLSVDEEYPFIIVTSDDEEVDYEVVKSSADCEATVSEIYDTWLPTGTASNTLVKDELDDDEPDYESEIREKESIDQREMELDECIDWILSEIAPEYLEELGSVTVDEVFSDLKDMICEYLYKKCGISVYRPMYLENEHGIDEYYEYPYPEMDI